MNGGFPGWCATRTSKLWYKKWQTKGVHSLRKFTIVSLIILDIHPSSSVTIRSSLSYIYMHKISSQTSLATTLLTDIFTARYHFLLSNMEHLWGNIKAACHNTEYTFHKTLIIGFFLACGIGATVNLSPLNHASPFGNWGRNPDKQKNLMQHSKITATYYGARYPC